MPVQHMSFTRRTQQEDGTGVHQGHTRVQFGCVYLNTVRITNIVVPYSESNLQGIRPQKETQVYLNMMLISIELGLHIQLPMKIRERFRLMPRPSSHQ